MAQIKAKILDDNTIEIMEDAKAGDTINLKDLVSVDLSFMQDKIREETSSLYQQQINEQFKAKAEKLVSEYQAKINELKNSYQQEIKDINNKLENKDKEKKSELDLLEAKLNNQYQEELNKMKNELEKAKSDKDNALELQKANLNNAHQSELTKLQNELAQIKHDKDKELELQKANLNSSYQNELNKLKTDLSNADKDKQLALLNKETEYKEILNKKEADIVDLNNQIDNLKLTKSSLNVKKLGEELERWCNEEYNHYAMFGFNNCTWKKDNKAEAGDNSDKGTKADYIFRCYLDDKLDYELTSVCLEMKNEDPLSQNKKKNSDHYNKLDKDRTKKNCEYALLVSELEWDTTNDSPIKKIAEYDKMYLVRPQYFITFLSLISSLASKYKDILQEKGKEELLLKDKLEVQEMFDKLIKTYISDPIKTLNTKVQDILKSSEAIKKANDKINETCNDIINTTINNIQNKVETLELKQLKSLYKKLDKINGQ